MIQMNGFKKEYSFFQKNIEKAVKATLESGWYILGKNVDEFEKEFAKSVGSKYCIGVANGMEALQIALMSLGVSEGDEVITVANTAVATALAISNIGAKPVFVDIDEYYHLDSKKIEEKITSKTKAIIPVHLFGQMVDIKEILRIAKKNKLKVIEDACQSHGALMNGKKAGSFGDLGCFSFYPTKNLGCYGDGGAITTDSLDYYKMCKMIRNYGQITRYEHQVKGLNSRLDEIQAAILRVKLRKLDFLNKRRQKIAKLYFSFLRNIKELSLPQKRSNAQHVYHLFVIKTEQRNALQKYLKEAGIETLIHYPIPVHKQNCYKDEYDDILPKTEKASSEILSLPINPFMSKEEVKKVCDGIKKFYKENIPSVTVAISAYNEQYNIVPFLDSVLSQEQKGFKFDEILVISDGSEDDTSKVVIKFIEKIRKEKNKKYPKINFLNYQERIGKSSRLNEIFAHLKSDYLVLADADVIFDSFAVSSLIKEFSGDSLIGLVGGSPAPLKAETFIEKCVNATFEAYLPIRQNYKNGNSILSATGRIMALKNEVAKKITVPQNTISNDGFTYFSNLSLGYKYVCAQGALAYFRSPQNLKDQLNQNTRFQATHAFMKRYFPSDVVEKEYYIPTNLFIKSLLLQFFRHPLLSLSIFFINRYCQLKAILDLKKINALWETVHSSKKLMMGKEIIKNI